MTEASQLSYENIVTTNSSHFVHDEHPNLFARQRWSHAVALADQLRHNTEVKKNQQLREYSLNIPSADGQRSTTPTSVQSQTDRVKSFQNELLFAKTGNFNLDKLAERFLHLKDTFNRMLELDKNDMQQIYLATSITKAALLIILRTTESIVQIITKGNRNFPTLNSIISFIRSCHRELPIHGRLLGEWYKAAEMLDLLMDDSDWLVQPPKAYWTMHVCNETLAWARVVFNEGYRKKSIGRPIFDRDEDPIYTEGVSKE